MTVMIRTAVPGDAAAIALLHAASWRVAYRGMLRDAYLDGDIDAERAAVWESLLREPSSNQGVFVAEENASVVGFACAYDNDDGEWGTLLENLHVSSACKGRGIGTRLASTVAAWSAASCAGKGMYLWVLDGNAAARRFCERLGGQCVERDIWQPPGGGELTKLRYVWPVLNVLLAMDDGSLENVKRIEHAG